MKETWKPCANYPGYEVSDQGRVRNSAGALLTGYTPPDGYPVLTLSVWPEGRWPSGVRRSGDASRKRVRKKVRVHRLVLETFLGSPPPGQEALHRNDVKSDNRLENLRWGTTADNRKDALNNGRTYAKHAKLSAEQVAEIRELVGKDDVTQKDIADRYGVTQPNISYIKRGISW